MENNLTNVDALKKTNLDLIVEVGRSVKTIEEISLWRKGITIKLEDSSINVLKVYLNNKYFAYGNVWRNEDGEMSLKLKEIVLGKKEIGNVPKDNNL